MRTSVIRAGRIEIEITDQARGRLPAAELLRAARIIFGARAGRRPLTLTLLCVGARRMIALNRRFKRHRGLTDVLSFESGETDPDTGRLLVGEVIVCRPVAAREARARGLDEAGELLLYAVHGWLHLAGHDDGTPTQRRRMAAAERRILKKLGYRRD